MSKVPSWMFEGLWLHPWPVLTHAINQTPELCPANQWTVFYMIETSFMKELNISQSMSIYKHQNITSALVLTIVFGIHYNFFIALPIRLSIFRPNDYFVFYKAKFARRKIGRVSKVLRARALPIGIGRAISPGLSK